MLTARRKRRIFDQLDISAIRANANWRGIVSVLIIALVVAVVPLLFVLCGVEEDRS